MSFNFNDNSNNEQEPFYPEVNPQQQTDIRFQLMQGEKVLPADRDELSDRMSDLRLKGDLNQNQNQYFKPFNPNLIGVEARLNRSHAGKKNEYKDIINNRMTGCHNIQLLQTQPTQSIDNSYQQPTQSIQPQFKDDRVFNNNYYQTNRVSNRDKNNSRLNRLMPLGNNCNFPAQQINTETNNRMGVNSNSYFDSNGNMQMKPDMYNTNQMTEEKYKQTNHTIMTNNRVNNIQQNHNNIQQNHHVTQQTNNINNNNNIMTIGRLPESNQNSRVNFKDKANQRLQNLVSLPRTSSIPFVQSYQPQQKNVWANNQQNIKNIKQRINELHQNCPVVVNNMMPVDTSQIDYD